ncbi:zinc finger protein Elbow [Scaptodrosophila lebanonensis]|uniref:Zinc finger protein Elbow n=1 Tax=Drosophila lebanonensis TaxID=7225 RepID=A0A6J2TNA8_DROLE|nr:zinc finger protein Elbow [Scaptodrosophila lebanonensis]
MLQSSNHHYLRPDYMAAAAPTALDNKSSPLALLAQTCSAIGADTANPKLLAANIEKSTKTLKGGGGSGNGQGGATTGGGGGSGGLTDNARDKSSPVSSHSSSVSTGSVEQQPQPLPLANKVLSTFKPYESNNNHLPPSSSSSNSDCGATNLTNSQQRVKTPKGSGTNGQRCDSNQSASSSQRGSPAASAAGSVATTNGLRRTPTAGAGGGGSSALDLHARLNGSPVQARTSSKESASLHSPSVPTTTTTVSSGMGSGSRLQAASEAALAAAKEASYVKALHAAAAAAGVQNSSAQGGAGSAYYPTGYGAYPMDLMAASTLMSPHHPMFKAAAMNPYLNYARLKGLEPMMSSPNVCRDPYCTGCPSSPHFLNKAAGQPCAAGCPQCESGKNGVGGNGQSPGGSSAAAVAAAAAASSYHAQLAALAAASQLPYVCSWIGSDAAYCGKRFGTSDDLFQHLRTHTASVPDSVLSAAAAGGIPPNHPLFQRTYPTPPLSPLSAAARYHPYGKPSMLPPSLAPPGLPGLPPHPALAQYFAPYSLYGPRMGSSHP